MAIASNASDEQHSLQRSTILRVYNYYRTLIAFLFLFLFLDSDFNTFVGEFSPDLFRTTSLVYLGLNIIVGIGTLFVSAKTLSRTAPSFIIIVIDIICLSLLIAASGGVSSGLGNFLIFTCAFSGSLVISGRISSSPARHRGHPARLRRALSVLLSQPTTCRASSRPALLGVILLRRQCLSFRPHPCNCERPRPQVVTLEQTNQLIIDTMKTGVVVVASDGGIRSINHAAGERFSPHPLAAGDRPRPTALPPRR